MSTNVEKLLRIALMVPMTSPTKNGCRWGAPILFWGEPGIGKSGRVTDAGASCDLPVETVYLSTHSPEDLSGVPMSDGKGGVTMVCSLPQIRRLVDNKRGILFLDELSCARPAVQSAGLAVVYERVAAGERLPGGVRVVAAANPPESAAGGWALPPPMANRFMHIDVAVPDVADWTEWLLETDEAHRLEDVAATEAAIAQAWNGAWSRTRGLAAGFMRSSSNKLHALPAVGHRDRGRAWASPRSWEMMLRTLTTCRILEEEAVSMELIEGTLGTGIAKEWLEWTTKADLPSPEDILKNGWTPDKRRLDVAFAAYSAAITFVLGTPKPAQRDWAILAWRALSKAILEKSMADIVLPATTRLMRAGYNTKAGEDINAVAREAIIRLGTSGVAGFAPAKDL